MKKFQKVENAPRLRDTLTRGIRKAENRISDCGLRIANWGWGMGRRVRFKATAARSILTSPRSNCRAFTLIELLGVMAIIGILSAVLLPPLISRIEDANTTKEDANLEEIARALVAGIKAQGRIPNPNVNPTASAGWAAMATNYSVLGTNELILSIPSSTNETVRRYFLSPSLVTFLNGNYTAPARGWATNNFTNGPLYLMLASVSKDGLLFDSGCTTNANMASNDVLFLQNWAKTNNTAGRVEVNNLNIVGNIFDTSDRWTNRGQFLHVKVVDLKQLFCKVDLTDTAAPENIAGFTVTTAGTGYPPSSTVNVSFGNNILAFAVTPEDTFADNTHRPTNGTYESGEKYLGDRNTNGVADSEDFEDGVANGIYDTADTLNDNNGDGIYSLSGGILTNTVITFSKYADCNTRRSSPLVLNIPGGAASFTAPVSPNAPTYDLISTTAGSGNFATQTVSIYVIKGSSINLFNGTGVIDKSVVIQSDVQYRYFNNSWTRVD